MTRPPAARLPLLRCIILALMAGSAGTADATVDPFYVDLLEQGSRQLEVGDPAEAERLLRIAAFGLLDEPERLADALVRLAIARNRLRDGDGFREVFRRLQEIEERFGAYSSGALDPAVRGAFEEAVPQHISEEVLRATAAFEQLADRRLELRLSSLPMRQQRRELERRVRERPGDAERRLALARFELGAGNRKRALPALDSALTIDPGLEPARCLRGRLRSALGDCAGATADLDACGETPERPDLAAASLHCLVRLERWPEAARLLDRLGPAARADPEIVRLAERVTLRPEARPDAPPPQPARAEPQPGAAQPSEAPPKPAEADAAVDEIRERLRRVRDPESLSEVTDAARRLAESSPGSVEAQLLAAETAYRSAQWQEAARHFDRARPLPADRPVLGFYYSVALFESGRAEEASRELRRVLPQLARTPFVETYVERILGGDGSS